MKYQQPMRPICFESLFCAYQVANCRDYKCFWILYTEYLYTFSTQFWILSSFFFKLGEQWLANLPFEGSVLYICQKLHEMARVSSDWTALVIQIDGNRKWSGFVWQARNKNPITSSPSDRSIKVWITPWRSCLTEKILLNSFTMKA